jgi:ATP-binding cassette, subfamily B, bacterial HlyB/CyaB
MTRDQHTDHRPDSAPNASETVIELASVRTGAGFAHSQVETGARGEAKTGPQAGAADHDTQRAAAEASETDNPNIHIQPPSRDATAAHDSGFLTLTTIARYLGVAADSDHLRHLSGKGTGAVDATTLLRMAKGLGLKARLIQTSWERLEKLALPAIAQRHDGSFFILLKVGYDKVLLNQAGSNKVDAVAKEDFLATWNERLLLVTSRARLVGEERPFDWTWFIPVLVRYRHLLGEVLVISFFLQLFGLVTPLFFQVIIDKVLVHQGLTTLHVLIFGLIVISIFESVMGGLRTYVFTHTTSRIDVELGARLFRHLSALPLKYFASRRVGQTVARVRELESIRNFLTSSAVTVLIDSFFTIVFFAVMWFYSPTLTLIVLASIPAYVLLSVLVTPVLRRRLDEKFYRGAENQSFLVESVSGMETLKTLAIEPQAQSKWEEQIAGYVSAGFRANQTGNMAQQVAGFINKLVMALILWIGATLVIEGKITVGQLVAFNMLSGRVAGPILRMSQLWQDFQQVRISVARLGDVLNTPPEPSAKTGAVRMPVIKGIVEFDKVTFRYETEGREIVRNVSFVVPSGQVVGIVGPSGSGKSTLTKLIQRLYLPSSGRVMVDGIDLSMADPAWLRRQVGVVLQENFLFNRTVRENIALIDPAMDMGRVVTAAKLAGAHEFILELPQGYDTILEERGSNLSGGQRQRVAIARALINNPRILIFDEATSALDYESERVIQDNMGAICRDRTVFIIAHRLSTVRTAHRILTIERGALVEDGTHDQLLRAGGRYAALHRYQAG